ncbi:DUF2500 domain-containing protein [Streptomyces montanus]|uniref:DUF2500 domain-containing protein n=1 Tax=Streptomyces montanus TaxID=2580423 RepID=A0A5R9FSM5_9ACTN|nr:DUF2500 domain-containing protein [Streptomyces montanus]TLS42555.1 DUF2500 domain-containing protein [Streptomyces montanus]
MGSPRRTAAVTALAAALALSVAGCGYEPGPSGRVIDKDYDAHPMTGTEEYRLTVRSKDGDEVEFRVISDDYHDCYRGSAYPTCTKVDR